MEHKPIPEELATYGIKIDFNISVHSEIKLCLLCRKTLEETEGDITLDAEGWEKLMVSLANNGLEIRRI